MKKREGERGKERPWATDWTDFLHGVMPGTGSAAPGSGNKSGHKATASRGVRVSRLMTYQKSKEPLEIYNMGRNLQTTWSLGYHGLLIKDECCEPNFSRIQSVHFIGH